MLAGTDPVPALVDAGCLQSRLVIIWDLLVGGPGSLGSLEPLPAPGARIPNCARGSHDLGLAEILLETIYRFKSNIQS